MEEEQRSAGDPFTVMAMVVAERVRITRQLVCELTRDLEGGDVDFDTPGLPELHRAVKSLLERLTPFVKS